MVKADTSRIGSGRSSEIFWFWFSHGVQAASFCTDRAQNKFYWFAANRGGVVPVSVAEEDDDARLNTHFSITLLCCSFMTVVVGSCKRKRLDEIIKMQLKTV